LRCRFVRSDWKSDKFVGAYFPLHEEASAHLRTEALVVLCNPMIAALSGTAATRYTSNQAITNYVHVISSSRPRHPTRVLPTSSKYTHSKYTCVFSWRSDWVHLLFRPLSDLRVHDRRDGCTAIGVMRIGRWNQSTRRNMPQCHSVHQKSHINLPGPQGWEVCDSPPDLWHGPHRCVCIGNSWEYCRYQRES
jgi:hypothetical protein